MPLSSTSLSLLSLRGAAIHHDDDQPWSTCDCGWTSSALSSQPLEDQITAHSKWCAGRSEQ
jgi:hypothetical protein